MTREPRPADAPVAGATPPAVATPAPRPRVAEPPTPVITRAPRSARVETVVAETESGPPAPVVLAPVAFETVPVERLAVELVDAPMPLRAEWVQIELLNIQ